MTKNATIQSRRSIFNVLGIVFFLFAAAFCRPVFATEMNIEIIHDYSCDTFNEQKDYEINIPAGTTYLIVQMFRVASGQTGIAELTLPDLEIEDIYPTDILTRLPTEPEPYIIIWNLNDQNIGSTTLRIYIDDWQNHSSQIDIGVYAVDTYDYLSATTSHQVMDQYPDMYPQTIYSSLKNLIFGIPYNLYDSFTPTYSSDTINQQSSQCFLFNTYRVMNGLYSNGETLPSNSFLNNDKPTGPQGTFGYWFQLEFSEGIPPEPPEIYPLSYYGIIITPDQNTCFGNQKIRIQQDNSADFFLDNPSTNVYKSKLLEFATIASTSLCNASTMMTSGNFFDYYTPTGYINLATTTTPIGKNEICIKYWQQGFLDDIFATTTIIVAPATSTACTTAQLPPKTSWCKFSDLCSGEASSSNEFFYGVMCGTRLVLCWAFAPTPSALDFINSNFTDIKNVVPFAYYYNLSDSILAGFATSSFANASSTIGLPMYNGNTKEYYIVPVINSSSISNLIGATNAQIFRDTISYFIWAGVAILIITILIFIIPLIL